MYIWHEKRYIRHNYVCRRTFSRLKSLGSLQKEFKMVVKLVLLHLKVRGSNWRTDLCFWSSHKCVLLQDLDESHLSLHEGKPHPNAVARTPTKRHVADTGTLCLLLRSEPVGRAREGGIDQSGRKEFVTMIRWRGEGGKGDSTFLGQISPDLSSALGCSGGGEWEGELLLPWGWSLH